MSLISMHGAWLSFSDAPLLDNAELHIEDNERVLPRRTQRRR